MLTYEERARKLIHLDEETKIFLQGIRIARKEQGLTCRTLAQKLSINKNLISSYEYGKVFPKVGVFCELAEFFNLDISNNINYVFLNYPRKIITELKRLKNHYGFSVREIACILRKDRREILDMLNMNNQASPKIFAELLMLFNQEKHREHLINTLLSPIHKKKEQNYMNKELSASKAGFPCMRNLWYTVNGYSEDGESDKRTQRIFDVGTALEPVIVEWLRSDGWNVEYNAGSQNAALSVSIPVKGGTLTGHPDCIISKGTIQNTLVDIKTMNDRSFKEWKQAGTLKSKPQYATQLHIYAAGLISQGRKIERLGIVGVNKNNSEMYIDFFSYDPFRTENIKDYAGLIFTGTKEPELGCPAESWACNYCEFAEICGLYKKPAPVVKNDEPLTATEDAVIIAAMKELKQSRELGREVREMESHAKEVLNETVRDKGLRGIQGGGLVFTMTERTSPRFDSTAFKEAHPELVSEFTKSSTSVFYDVKEAV